MCLWKKVSFGWKLASCSRRGSYRSNHPACSPQDCTAQSSSLFWMEDNGGWTKVSNHVITGLVNSRFYMVPIQAPNKPALVVCWLVRSEESQVAFVFLTMATSTSRILANCFSFLESSERSSVPAQVSNGFKDSAKTNAGLIVCGGKVSSRESVGRAWPHFTSLTSNVIFRMCLPCHVGHIILLSNKTCLCCWVLRMGTCLAFNASNSMAHSCPLYCPHPCSLLPSGLFQLRVAGIKQVDKLSGPKSWVQRSKNESSKTIEKAAFNVIFLRATASEATGRGTTTNFKPPPIRPHRLCWLHHSYPCLPCNQ